MNEQFWQSYLFGLIFWLGLSLGCFALTLLHHTMNAKWGKASLRILEAGNKTLPIMFILLLVYAFMGAKSLYPWMHAETVPETEKALYHAVHAKAWYLNTSFWLIRLFVYFAIWIGLTTLLNRWSKLQDSSGDPNYQQARANLAAPGIVIFVISITFAFTDWVMSLDPTWISTIYGVWFAVGQVLLAVSFTVIFLLRSSKKPPFSEIMTPALNRDFGNLMLALTMLWAYISLSQYLIIWSGNLPEEIGYYITRAQKGWDWVGFLLIIGQFFFPFLLLLSGYNKRTSGRLMFIACWTVAMRIIDNYYVITPTFGSEVFSPRLVKDAIVWAVIGAIWYASFRFFLGQNTLVAKHELKLQEAMDHA